MSCPFFYCSCTNHSQNFANRKTLQTGFAHATLQISVSSPLAHTTAPSIRRQFYRDASVSPPTCNVIRIRIGGVDKPCHCSSETALRCHMLSKYVRPRRYPKRVGGVRTISLSACLPKKYRIVRHRRPLFRRPIYRTGVEL